MLVSILKSSFKRGSRYATCTRTLRIGFVELHSKAIDRSTLSLDLFDKVYSLGLLPHNRIVVVVNQNRLRPAFASHSESSSNELVVAIVATESLDNLVTGKSGMIPASTRFDSLVYDFNHIEVGEMPLNSVHPFCDGLFCFGRVKSAQPLRVMGPPYQCVVRKIGPVLFCPVIDGIAIGKIVCSAFFFNPAPRALVFGGNLVPVGAKIFGNFARCGRVAKELGCTIG